MNFTIDWLSFYLMEQPEEEDGIKQVRMTRYLGHDEYQKSELKDFLDGEFARIAKRKVEMNPKTEGTPTKLGQFVLEPGHPLDSNPNYALLNRLLAAETPGESKEPCQELIQSYLRTSQVRGGVMIVVRTRLDLIDERYVFILKCDFEQKTAVITDEKSLISNVRMAINAKNMKSLMYPYMIESGMNDPYHVKIHQFSHARYFEEFLRFIEYPQTMTQIVSEEVISLARQHIEYTYPEESEERVREEEAIELIAASPKRELAEKWEHETVMEAMQIITDRQPEVELKFKLDHMQIRTLLADYGTNLHIAKVNGRYLVLLEGEQLQFERGMSPVEFLKPKALTDIVKEIEERSQNVAYTPMSTPTEDDDNPPW
ncbi:MULTISPECIES: DUF3900 domain-containing protein [Brevibacillus]|uniref:DUF3898 domain-containing protein n=1 Tax=Brevibacillus brevis (strain 47 / JCM 6285 / NBRC 100599) TaxID=358681 RepID=C0ZEQ1_BREBN|nr:MULTISPECIES: DUF3900 domain-containing protein [Brevibacillus]MBH0330277.1 hypothetical protein [Brevibacillus brevis]NRS48824.1 DUF3900 domain-containing protein [Brevibacillus sp. HB2.2]UIO40279.1 DUF3900 domain-containing protein [Brevibacillus brevis]WGV57693.1 DUF3900 domain-containing protein [Brevibacillus brevis]WJQ79217.1 DUF3900 domain-containing protein [Brevibacillus brevis]